MRAFVAVLPSDDVISDLTAFLEPRIAADESLRWTNPAGWHITLAFMAALPDGIVEDLSERLQEVASGRESFELAIAGGGTFPGVSAARVLFAGITDTSTGLPRLATSVRGHCAKAGGAPDGGRFRPHFTLARMRRPIEATRWIRVLDTYAGPSWLVDRFALVESHLGQGYRGTPRYDVVDEFPFGG